MKFFAVLNVTSISRIDSLLSSYFLILPVAIKTRWYVKSFVLHFKNSFENTINLAVRSQFSRHFDNYKKAVQINKNNWAYNWYCSELMRPSLYNKRRKKKSEEEGKVTILARSTRQLREESDKLSPIKILAGPKCDATRGPWSASGEGRGETSFFPPIKLYPHGYRIFFLLFLLFLLFFFFFLFFFLFSRPTRLSWINSARSCLYVPLHTVSCFQNPLLTFVKFRSF